MKNIFLILILFMAIFETGCQAILLKLYGVKDPDYESYADIIKFQEDIGFGSVPYSGLKAGAWFQQHRLSVPDVYVFDAKGRYIPYKDSLKPNCNGPAEVFLAELDPKKMYHFSSDFTLNAFLELLEGAECQVLNFKHLQKVDFYIFMNYASFTGKRLYEEKTRLWYESLKQNSKINYQLLMVNMDLKDCWNPEEKKLFEGTE